MKRYILLVFSILFSANVLSLSLNQQRAVYGEAQLLQSQNKWDEANVKLDSIAAYPLTYLLTYQNLKKHISAQSVDEINAFITENKHYKASDDLQRNYLYYLASKKLWPEFLAFYPQLPRNNTLKCFYFQAKMAAGQEKEIWPEVKKVWLSGHSRPNSCDVVFNTHLKNKKISQKLIWQRFELAYNSNKKSLMKYLTNLMQEDNKLLAKQLTALNLAPKTLVDSELFQNRKQLSYSFLKPTIKRLARSNTALGLQVYQQYDKKIPFSIEDETSLKKYFSSRILIKNEQSLLPWLDKNLSSLSGTKLIEQRIRYAIKYTKWADIERWIGVLPAEDAQSTTWVYWQARVLENKKQFKEANKLYKQIADKRKYYGFLAAQKLGLSYHLNANIVEPKVATLDPVQAQLDHIEELKYHQQYTLLVKREWYRLLKGRDSEIQRQLGLYAFNKGWAHLSVLASIRSKSWDAINIRFPEVKTALFLENSLKYQVPSSYLYAITRQESALDQFAKSPVGATGYMQLMPATAKETARKIGLTDYKRKSQLTEGKINVQLGAAYFNGLLKRYDGNRILATAAYNAGPHRVNRWKQNKKGRGSKALGMDSWVEAIPYNETRRYVKNVLAYNVIYQSVLKKPMEFFNAKELKAYY